MNGELLISYKCTHTLYFNLYNFPKPVFTSEIFWNFHLCAICCTVDQPFNIKSCSEDVLFNASPSSAGGLTLSWEAKRKSLVCRLSLHDGAEPRAWPLFHFPFFDSIHLFNDVFWIKVVVTCLPCPGDLSLAWRWQTALLRNFWKRTPKTAIINSQRLFRDKLNPYLLSP